MATSKKTTTVNAKATVKEEKEMKNTEANAIINGIININTTQHKNKIELIQAGVNCAYVSINGTKVPGIIGGSKKEMEANQRCLQLMADNVESEDPMVIAHQCDMLTKVMANLENIPLDDAITVGREEYIIDTAGKRAYNCYGKKVVDINILYPELVNIDLDGDAIRAIVYGELDKMYNLPKEIEEENTSISIEAEGKLGVVDTIKALRALGMKSSWFDINGIRQMQPICYCGESDLKEFTKIVKSCVDNEQSYADIMNTAAKYNENGLKPDEAVEIDGTLCIIDYTKKELWSASGNLKHADIEDITYELPNEAVKAILVERAKESITRYNEEVEDYYDDDYDEYDEEYDDEDYDEDNEPVILGITIW